MPDKKFDLRKKFSALPVSTLFELRRQNLTYREIGEMYGITKQTVHQRYDEAGLTDHSLSHFVANRADIFAWMQNRLLFSLSDTDIKRMAPDRRVWAAAVLYDKERLERGQSTENINIKSIAVTLQGELEGHQVRSKAILEQLADRGICVTDLLQNHSKEVEYQDLGDNGHDPLDCERP